jgi:hypothetical protein
LSDIAPVPPFAGIADGSPLSSPAAMNSGGVGSDTGVPKAVVENDSRIRSVAASRPIDIYFLLEKHE